MKYSQEIPSPDNLEKLILKYRTLPDLVFFVDFPELGRYNPPGLRYQPFIVIIPHGERPDLENESDLVSHEWLDYYGIEYDLPPPIEYEITPRYISKRYLNALIRSAEIQRRNGTSNNSPK